MQYLSTLSQQVTAETKQYLTQTKDYRWQNFKDINKCGLVNDVPASRIFRERQSRRMFEDLKRVKASFAETYEELESMHREVLLRKKY